MDKSGIVFRHFQENTHDIKLRHHKDGFSLVAAARARFEQVAWIDFSPSHDAGEGRPQLGVL